MTRDTGRGRVPDLSRRDALALFGVGGVSITGGVGAFEPAVIVGLPRAEGGAISVERTVDGVEYRPASDTVRWSRSTGAGGPYETEPFEKWASRKAASVGSEAVLPAIRDRVDEEVGGIGTGIADEPIGMVVAVTVGMTYDRDGDVTSEPNLSVQEVIDVAPRTVHTKVTLEGREYTRPIPVFVEEADVYED